MVIGIPVFINVLTSKVPVLKATIPCGELTGKIKPKQMENWAIIVKPTGFTPGILTAVTMEITIGIMADAKAVADAKPK